MRDCKMSEALQESLQLGEITAENHIQSCKGNKLRAINVQ